MTESLSQIAGIHFNVPEIEGEVSALSRDTGTKSDYNKFVSSVLQDEGFIGILNLKGHE